MKWRVWSFAWVNGVALAAGWRLADEGQWAGWVAIAAGAWGTVALFAPARSPSAAQGPRVCGCGDPDCTRGCAS